MALVVEGCASGPRQVPRRDRFPLDPREGLAGPFLAETVRGCEALAGGDAEVAEKAFAAARSGGVLQLAAEIGWVEVAVLGGRTGEAIASCDRLLSTGEPTLPLLVACGEALAASGDPYAGHDLYRRAVARDSDRPGLNARAEELRLAARDERLAAARASAERGEWAAARASAADAIAVAPESSAPRVLAGDIEKAAGEKAAALRRYREAMDLEPRDTALLKTVGSLALELEDYALAVSTFDRLARSDPREASRAADARMAFRVANWPPAEREAAHSRHVTRAQAAELAWWMVPEVREGRVSSGIIASDAVARRDSRAVTRAVALGLLEVDQEMHTVSPDGRLSVPAASKFLIRLLGLLKPPPGQVACLAKPPRGPLTNSEAMRLASACGLSFEREAGGVSGSDFLRALDRARVLVSSAEGSP
jgi:tetratricopeptide (TPR) repeat protein